MQRNSENIAEICSYSSACYSPLNKAVLPTVLDHAIALATVREFRIIPVHGITSNGGCTCKKGLACQSAGKHPRINRWQEEATNNITKITEWFTMWPDSNVGVVTGSASGVFVIDVDIKSGGLQSIDDIVREHGLSPTLMVKTGSGGLHFYYRLPDGVRIKNSVSQLAPGIDIRGENGFVVAPPSVHKSGGRYEYL